LPNKYKYEEFERYRTWNHPKSLFAGKRYDFGIRVRQGISPERGCFYSPGMVRRWKAYV